MCLTGNLVLSVMLDESVLVPVMCEPAVPIFASTEEQKAALGVPDDDVRKAVQRAQNVQVLGFRFATDKQCPAQRFKTLERPFRDHASPILRFLRDPTIPVTSPSAHIRF